MLAQIAQMGMNAKEDPPPGKVSLMSHSVGMTLAGRQSNVVIDKAHSLFFGRRSDSISTCNPPIRRLLSVSQFKYHPGALVQVAASQLAVIRTLNDRHNGAYLRYSLRDDAADADSSHRPIP